MWNSALTFYALLLTPPSQILWLCVRMIFLQRSARPALMPSIAANSSPQLLPDKNDWSQCIIVTPMNRQSSTQRVSSNPHCPFQLFIKKWKLKFEILESRLFLALAIQMETANEIKKTNGACLQKNANKQFSAQRLQFLLLRQQWKQICPSSKMKRASRLFAAAAQCVFKRCTRKQLHINAKANCWHQGAAFNGSSKKTVSKPQTFFEQARNGVQNQA